MSFKDIAPGDKVRLTPLSVGAPTVEGFVASANYSYVTIRGLGFTQFQFGQFSAELLVKNGLTVSELAADIAAYEETPFSPASGSLATHLAALGYTKQAPGRSADPIDYGF